MMLKLFYISSLILLSLNLPAQTIKKITGVFVAKKTSDSTSLNKYNSDITYAVSERELKLDIEIKRTLLNNYHITNTYQIKKQTQDYIIGLIDNPTNYEYIFYNIKDQEFTSLIFNNYSYDIRSISKNPKKSISYNNQLYKKLNLGYTPKEMITVLIQDTEKDY